MYKVNDSGKVKVNCKGKGKGKCKGSELLCSVNLF